MLKHSWIILQMTVHQVLTWPTLRKDSVLKAATCTSLPRYVELPSFFDYKSNSSQEREIPDTMTIVSFSGIIDQKYVLTFNWSAKPRARKFAEGWPATPEENLERLANCGLPHDRLIPKCENCGEMGHIKKHCKQERGEATGRIEVR